MTIEIKFIVFINEKRISISNRFNNNKILFNIDVCGLQQLPSAEKMAESLPDHLSRLEKIDYELKLKNKQVLRIIEDKPYYIPTSSRDIILVEKRQDMSIRSITYELLDSSSGLIVIVSSFIIVLLYKYKKNNQNN